jgi:hypothetical protein
MGASARSAPLRLLPKLLRVPCMAPHALKPGACIASRSSGCSGLIRSNAACQAQSAAQAAVNQCPSDGSSKWCSKAPFGRITLMFPSCALDAACVFHLCKPSWPHEPTHIHRLHALDWRRNRCLMAAEGTTRLLSPLTEADTELYVKSTNNI